MVEMIYVIAGVAVLLVSLLLLFVSVGRKTKMPPTDYYNLFIMGIIFTGSGIPLFVTTKNFGLFGIGIIFMITGLVHKKDWEKNRKANEWKNLTKAQRKFRKKMIWIMLGVLGLGVLAGISVVLFLV